VARLRPIGHEDHLSIVEHLDELRTRLLLCGGVLLVVFCGCFWQNQALISALNRALPTNASRTTGLASIPSQSVKLHEGMQRMAAAAAALAAAPGLSPVARADVAELARGAQEAAKALPKSVSEKVKPITIGVGESFTTTLTVVAYFALLISLPLILYQMYAFVLPALNKQERKVATPSMIAAPALFAVGAVFTYFMVLPPAVHFLQGYNSSDFDILVQAKTYYKFEMFMMIGIGLAFQVPLLLLALQKLGLITASTLTVNWRYAIVIIAIVAAALPGVDPVTMTFETLPLVLLYLASIVLLKFVDHRNAKREAAEFTHVGGRGLDIS
jgi:sec-independent protein translocase protein TatC